eukprot:TRINITY_DN4279_c0_g1_i3.p1 TRINITY_DN4279_c0_g1~~TRINITY_DN4279_c0_g1_i3.p1  ORF type:complete len:248 (+),score=76.70 TRINITY_DN4279_c0_g1_i3:69-812(+)
MGKEKKEPKAKASKAAKATKGGADDEETEIILNYLNTQNRPFNYLMLFNNLHQRVGKTQVQKILDTLTENSQISTKVYGKSAIYYARQDQFPIPEKDELQSMDEEIKKKTAALTELSASNKTLTIELQRLESALTEEEIEQRIKDLNEENAKLAARLERLGDGSKLITEEQKVRANKAFTTAIAEWKKRKRMTTDVISTLAEHADKKTSEIREMIGVETDEEARVNVDQLVQSVSSEIAPAAKKPRS